MAGSVESSTARGRVLLVDDEPLVLDAYRRVLQRGGFDVEVMESGLGVGARVDDEEFDVVISDIAMPVANGMQVIRNRCSSVQRANCSVTVSRPAASLELPIQRRPTTKKVMA